MGMPVKHWYESKTVWFGIATILVGTLTAIHNQFPEVPILTSIIGFINILLRLNTTTSIA